MIMKSIAAAAAIAALPFAVNAATVSSDDFSFDEDFVTTLMQGSAGTANISADSSDSGFSQTLEFVADERLSANGSVTVNNFDSFTGLDIMFNMTSLTLNEGLDDDTATATLPSIFLNVGDSFTVTTSFDSLSGPGDVDVLVETSAVPVPASAVLFGTALAGLGFAARRRKS